MKKLMSVQELTSTLRRVVGDQYVGRPLFFWQGPADKLRDALGGVAEIADTWVWLDVNSLAQDVMPLRAAAALRARLSERLMELIADGRRVLLVQNPYLLLRYSPSAPLGAFWNTFVASNRAIVVLLPQAVSRPSLLPDYVKFRGDRLPDLLTESTENAQVVSCGGGDAPC